MIHGPLPTPHLFSTPLCTQEADPQGLVTQVPWSSGVLLGVVSMEGQGESWGTSSSQSGAKLGFEPSRVSAGSAKSPWL